MNINEMSAPLVFDRLPDDALVRPGQLVSKCGSISILPFGATTLYRKVQDGSFPAPIKLGKRITAWRAGDVRAWLVQQVLKSDDAQRESQEWFPRSHPGVPRPRAGEHLSGAAHPLPHFGSHERQGRVVQAVRGRPCRRVR
mgnify:CR=1 FL=1